MLTAAPPPGGLTCCLLALRIPFEQAADVEQRDRGDGHDQHLADADPIGDLHEDRQDRKHQARDLHQPTNRSHETFSDRCLARWRHMVAPLAVEYRTVWPRRNARGEKAEQT